MTSPVPFDQPSIQTLIFERDTLTQDAEGHPSGTTTTVLATVTGDVQPERGEIKEGGQASAEQSTHVIFADRLIPGVKPGDFIRDENSVRYVIMFVAGYRQHHQEFECRLASDLDG